MLTQIKTLNKVIDSIEELLKQANEFLQHYIPIKTNNKIKIILLPTFSFRDI